tara:strand:+ start:2790 stop:3194 length:405 start_codon:yes stop_codon:yes gene_type:complete
MVQIQIKPDKEKAKYLVEMAELTQERLNLFNKKTFASNTLTDYYDILHKLMEAITCLDGIKFKGESAHYQLTKYICKEYNLSQKSSFLQELRIIRNKVCYEGLQIDKEYLNTYTQQKIERIISYLKEIIKQKLK